MWLLKLIINLHNCYIRWAIAAVKTDDPTLLFQAKACACAYATAGIGMCLFALAQLILPLFGVAIVHTISLAYVITVSSIIVSLWLLRYGFLQFSALLTVLAALYGQLVMSWEFGGLALFFIRGHLVIQISAILFGFKGISLACIVNMIGAYVLYRLELTGFDVWHGSDPKKRIIELYAYGFYFLAFTFLFTSIINYTRQNLIKSLQEANKHKSNFLSKVSHEIRTPLAGIIGAIDILSTTKLNDDQMSLLATAKNCSQTLMEIINDVLDLSKIESGKLKINMEKVHLSSLIESCFKIVSPLMEKKNVKSICRIPCNVPKWIVTDPIKLKQILINLLSNATKVTNNGTIAVSVSIRRKRTLSYETSDDILKLSSQNGNDSKETEEINSTNAMMICEKQEDTNERLSLREERQRAFSASDSSNSSQMYLKFSVIDSGIGIEKEKLLTLFEPFSQVVPSEKRTEGTGLGLAITKQLVEKMGGSIHVYSAGKGKGSSFYFYLPCIPCRGNTQSNELSSNVSSTQFNSQYNGITEWSVKSSRVISSNDKTAHFAPQTWDSELVQYNLRILVVEDNAINQMIICRLLERFGCNVEIATNGQEAIDILKAKSDYFHLIFMDLEMPILNGLEATKIIRQSLHLKIPIVALSANALTEHEQNCLAAGMQTFLRKPISLTELQHTLRKFCSFPSMK